MSRQAPVQRPLPAVASAPYPWPFAGDLAGERLAVVVAGAQAWAFACCDQPGDTLAVVQRTAAHARAAGALVVWVAHRRPAGRATRDGGATRTGRAWTLPEEGSPGARLAVSPAPGDVVVGAGGVDGFYSGPLDDVLRAGRRTMVVLAGAGLETLVHSTLRSANDRGYECLTLADGTAAWDRGLAGAALSSICMSGGIFGAVATSDALVDALDALDALDPPSARLAGPPASPMELPCPSPS